MEMLASGDASSMQKNLETGKAGEGKQIIQMVRISRLCQANSIQSTLPRILYYICLLLLSILSI